jgi:glyoxylase I family protein
MRVFRSSIEAIEHRDCPRVIGKSKMGTPLKVADIDHVVLRCRDQKRAYDFYTRVLGLAEERRIEKIGLIQLRAGASMIDLVPAQRPRSEEALNVEHVCLGIEATDMNQIVTYLRDLSVEVIGEPTQRYGARGMGLSIYIRDSEGNVIELKQISVPR